jgi:hypothetical protein
MNDDIVTRLRAFIPWANSAGDDLHAEHLAEAADEIERLRKEVTTWIICAERLVESQQNEQYEKALAFYVDCQRIANETCQ